MPKNDKGAVPSKGKDAPAPMKGGASKSMPPWLNKKAK